MENEELEALLETCGPDVDGMQDAAMGFLIAFKQGLDESSLDGALTAREVTNSAKSADHKLGQFESLKDTSDWIQNHYGGFTAEHVVSGSEAVVETAMKMFASDLSAAKSQKAANQKCIEI